MAIDVNVRRPCSAGVGHSTSKVLCSVCMGQPGRPGYILLAEGHESASFDLVHWWRDMLQHQIPAHIRTLRTLPFASTPLPSSLAAACSPRPTSTCTPTLLISNASTPNRRPYRAHIQQYYTPASIQHRGHADAVPNTSGVFASIEPVTWHTAGLFRSAANAGDT